MCLQQRRKPSEELQLPTCYVVGSCLATKFFIGNLPATGGGGPS